MRTASPRPSLARQFGLVLTLARGSRSVGAVLVGALLVLGGAGVSVIAQIPGRNVNMVAGTEWPGGDPFLQRQNEPSMAASTRNPLHLVAGSNDYRTVDLPGLPDDVETGDAWVSVYKSFDGGARWSSTLMPGYPQDTSEDGLASPLKGYQAAADPVVRAGTNGLIYYNGLVFDRGDNGKSGIFLTRFIDRNNKENGDPIAYVGTSMVASSNGTVFLDKPWMAVDLARNNAPFCVVGGTATGGRVKRAGHRLRGASGQTGSAGFVWVDPGLQYVPAGAIYVAYTSITGEGSTLRAEILLKRSLDCGATWSAPMRVSRPADAINQGATLAIDPADGDVFVAYRRFATPEAPTADAVMVARLPVGQMTFAPAGMARALPRTDSPTAALERIFEHRKKRAQTTTTTAPAPVTSTTAQIDQGTSPYSFRTNAYPTMAIDGTSRVYVAWSERGFGGARPDETDGDARIRVATTLDAATFVAPVTVENPTESATGPALPGHQLMPSLTFAGGKLMLVYYDLRETRANVFGPFVSDQGLITKRQTIDIRASLGTPGATPSFAPSVRVSDYLEGYRSGTSIKEQLQVNPPNLPMFKLGTVPFIGDYIDVAPSPAFVPTGGGGWAFNTAVGTDVPVFHAVWTDNRDVRPPLDGNWQNYTPPTINGQFPGSSLFDPTQTVAVCRAGNAGSRNQNIYTARISGGLLVGSPGNSKPLSPTVQRGFVVFAQNQTTVTKTFRMSILAQPLGAPLSGRASFEQFPRPPYSTTAPPPPPLTTIDVRVPARSTASRTVYATSTDPKAQLSIDVREISAVGGGVVDGGLAGRTVLNPDIENPDIENPDIENPDIENPDIENAEVYNPDIENPDIENPDIENPDIENPDIENPDIENVVVANPDIENIGVGNPDIENPDIENPDIENPDIENPDIENGTVSDVTWTVSNIGNTTSAFNVNVFLAAAGVPSGINTQLIVYKTYKTPVLAIDGCTLKTETRNVLQFNVPSPNLITPGEGLPDQNDPSEQNATLWLNPGEVGRVTLRVYDNDRSDNVIVTNPDGTTASIDPRFNPNTVTTVGISGQGVDVLDPPGATEPPAVTTTGTNLFFLQQPTNTAPGATLGATVGELFAPVRVRVWDNTGAPLPGVLVTMALCGPPNPLALADPCPAPPAGVLLSAPTTALANVDGIATLGTLSVNLPATGLRLRATAAAAGVVAAGTSAPFDVTLTGGPVSLWRAEGNTLDSVGTNHGTLQGGAGYTAGRIGPGFSFSNPAGTATPSQFVLVPDAPSLRITNQLTMSAWIYPTGPGRGGAEGGIILNKEWAYEMARFADGTIRSAFGDGNGSFLPQTSWVNSGVVAPENSWTHVAVTYNLGVVTTFINGLPVNTTNLGFVNLGTAGYTVPHSLRIGGRELPAYPAFFDGRIDEVGLQNRALTPAEVLTLYNAAPAQVPVTLAIGNVNAIWDGSTKPVTVTPGVPVVTLYNSSTTVPSAIGAYLVQAIALSPNTGAASVNHKIASTLPAGGNGGGPFPASGALSCAPGVFARGVRASNTPAYGLLSGQLLCSSGPDPARFVALFETAAPSYTDVTCGAGEVMVGLNGQRSISAGFPVVATMGPVCRSLTTGVTTNGPVAGGGNPADTFNLMCGGSDAVTGVLGGLGEVIDSIALVCGALPVAPPVLVSRWPFDGNTNDAVGSNNAIATNALSYPPGRIGSGVSIGSGGYVDIADASTLRLQRFTYSAWVIPVSPNTAGPDFVGDVIFTSGTDDGLRIRMVLAWRAVDGRFVFGLGGAPSTQSAGEYNPFVESALLVSTSGVPAGQFHHVAATYDGTTMRLYVNGLPQGELAYATTVPYLALPSSIGANTQLFRGGALERDWRGVIDDLRLYQGALTPAEVLALYNAAPPAPGGTITSASPSTVAAGAGQLITLRGTNFPNTSQADVLFRNGAGPEYPADYLWAAGPGIVMARLPALGGLTTGAASVRIRNAGDTLSTAPFPITISTTPGAPVLTSLLTSCAGVPTTTVSPGGAFSVEAEGIDTYGLDHEFVWTLTGGGSSVSQTGWAVTGGPTGRVCTTPQSGAQGVTSGSWTLQLRTRVSGVWSALSNAIAVAVP